MIEKTRNDKYPTLNQQLFRLTNSNQNNER